MLLDKDIREPLFEFLEEYYGKIRIIEEKQMGRSRADVVMVTPEALYGIEIKSDADTYARLTRQVKDYDLFFDYNFVVVGSTHAAHVSEHVPEWWGILSVEQEQQEAQEQQETKVDFYVLREPQPNPKMQWKKKISLLWRVELVHIQELNAMPKYKDKSKLFVSGKILEKVPPEVLNTQLCEELFQRDYSTIADVINTYRAENNKPKKRKRKRIRIKKEK